ncbi:predicted protein [Lichtheimia corymbifera JMRC:FSU:9682]|uniref:Uncharacterized protein n=1 Tax=Lichtheimia corymbifera JMRC:FSU:9682 TaxID=1263082 RepID=A0A068S7I0_9FUNG|nr:predicted protein [Lichtheimia corymbifera JMRC:FSU:9682]
MHLVSSLPSCQRTHQHHEYTTSTLYLLDSSSFNVNFVTRQTTPLFRLSHCFIIHTSPNARTHTHKLVHPTCVYCFAFFVQESIVNQILNLENARIYVIILSTIKTWGKSNANSPSVQHVPDDDFFKKIATTKRHQAVPVENPLSKDRSSFSSYLEPQTLICNHTKKIQS